MCVTGHHFCNPIAILVTLMDAERSIADLVAQVRNGDQAAAAALVREYEPYIRRAARNRLRTSQLRRVLDSVDVSQSVLASLFDRTARGQYTLENAEQLERLLVTMVRNKVTDVWRRYSVRILGMDGVELAAEISPGLPVDEALCQRELVELARSRLSPDDLQLFTARSDGAEWTQLALQYGTSAEALRKRLARALERVAEELTGSDDAVQRS